MSFCPNRITKKYLPHKPSEMSVYMFVCIAGICMYIVAKDGT